MMTERSNEDFEGLIRDIIRDECKYFGAMMGQVTSTDDELKQGRIQVIIPALGHYNQNNAIWVCSRDKHLISVPIVGDWVEIRFMDGHRDRAYYCGICNQVAEQTLKNYDGNRTTHILFENPNESSEYIKYDEVKKELDILMNLIKVNSGTDFAVKFNALKTGFDQLRTELNSLVTVFNSHVHPIPLAQALSPVSPPPSSPPTVSGVPAVADISLAKVDKVML